jgi:large subunit ribosomal protein L22
MADTKTGYRATAKWLIASPSKVRPVADLVRKKPYAEAIAILDNVPNKGAGLIRKVVVSAAANALNRNRKLDEDMLYVREIRIDEGPRMRRVWFRARGRADMLIKRMCHISCVIDEIGKKTEA